MTNITASAVLAKPVPCTAPVPVSTYEGGWCVERAWGPDEGSALCPIHGGPDPDLCEVCDLPGTDDDGILTCEWQGSVHTSCHNRTCTSRLCHVVNDPDFGSGD